MSETITKRAICILGIVGVVLSTLLPIRLVYAGIDGTGVQAIDGTGTRVIDGTGALVIDGTGAHAIDGTGALVIDGTGVHAIDGTGALVIDGTGAHAIDGTGARVIDGTGSFVIDGTGALVIDGTGAHAIDGTGAWVIDGTGSFVIDGTGALVIDGTGANAIDGTGARVIDGTGSFVIDGTGALVIDGTGANAIDGTGALVIDGTGLHQIGLEPVYGSDLLALGRVDAFGDGFMSVMGQTIFGARSDFAGISAGATVAIYGSIDTVTGGFANTRIVPVSPAGVDAGMPSFLRGTVDAVDLNLGLAVVSGMSVDYTALLSHGVAPRVGDQVAVSGRAYRGLGLLVAELDAR